MSTSEYDMLISEVIHADPDIAGTMWQKLQQKHYSTGCGDVGYVGKSKFGESANCGNCKFYAATGDRLQGTCNWQKSVCNKKVSVMREGWCKQHTALKATEQKGVVGTGSAQDPIQATATQRK